MSGVWTAPTDVIETPRFKEIMSRIKECSDKHNDCEDCPLIPCGDGKGICTLADDVECWQAHNCCLASHDRCSGDVIAPQAMRSMLNLLFKRGKMDSECAP